MLEATGAMRTINICNKGLDAAMVRQRVISDNIANVNTPGFKKSHVTYEYYLQQALHEKGKMVNKVTAPGHIVWGGEPDPTRVSAGIVIENDTIYKNDGNNVDINDEMTALSKNTIMYEAITTRVADKFRLLNTVIKGGR
ncbi:flagellar basal body rod protein FlgB [Candidatus Desantisbacteria bacterium CG23_combo_of_CG06-09_8_20_14_all_40_23]|uniref:Flagellar basal body rod protein FlgB n=1 Tax=Candidatus Desantisbacteria bacterium CG23_combo_of_CG06-09_8_20_14_all_40_23 TaxID=1974550 RepID=A0A2H0ABX8_9BACT|nr:MAG: flagellar basal body rod protein FlgB [Candidatus Desantisbacteria bacterium CG23_combo_of_CG06-09_8_20_14_all_40_23]